MNEPPAYPKGAIKTVEELRALADGGKHEKVFITYSNRRESIIVIHLEGLRISRRKEEGQINLYFPNGDQHKGWWSTYPDLWLPDGAGGWFIFTNFWFAWAHQHHVEDRK